MRVLVVNQQDPASTNIRDHLLEDNDWQQAGTFRGHPLYQRAYDILVQVDGPTVTDEHLSMDLADTGWPIDAVWFLSKHVAASGEPSLTGPSGGAGRPCRGPQQGTALAAGRRLWRRRGCRWGER